MKAFHFIILAASALVSAGLATEYKQVGLIATRELITLPLDAAGDPEINTLCPARNFWLSHEEAPWNAFWSSERQVWYTRYPARAAEFDEWQPADPKAPWNLPEPSRDPADYPGLLWTPPAWVPLLKLDAPEFDPETQRAEPVLVWHADRVERQWTVVAYTPPVPAAVTRRQLRLELLSRGLLANVTAALNGIPDEATKAAALIEWEDATTFDRAHPLVGQIGAALGLTSAQLDDIWRAAAARTFTPTAP